jgi:hypothetical protein
VQATVGLMPLACSQRRDVVRAAQSVSGGKAVSGFVDLQCLLYAIQAFAGNLARPELDAIVSSGVFEQCLGIVQAFERAGVEGLSDVSPTVLFCGLNVIKYLRSHRDCEAKIRGLGSGLAFAMEHSLDHVKAMGMTTGGCATQICEQLPHQNVYFSPSLQCCRLILLLPVHTYMRATTGCGVFGRDEGGGGFEFTQHHVDTLCAVLLFHSSLLS